MDTLKLENISVKGSATVELKNGRGKTIEKVEGNNFISSTVLNHALRAMQRSFFSIPFNNRDFYDLSHFFPTHMLYTDSAVAESPLTEVAVTGNTIGFSTLEGATSTDTRRGILNVVESSHNINRTRIVCDWPTDKGNGVCRSIYFTLGETLPTLPPPMHTLNAAQHTITNGALRYAFITSNNEDLFLGNNTSTVIHQLRNNMIISNTIPSPTGFIEVGWPNWFTVIGNNVYTLSNRNLFVTPVGGTASTLLASNVGNFDHNSLLAVGNIIHIFPTDPHAQFNINRYDIGTMQQLPPITITSHPLWSARFTSFPLSSTVIRAGGPSRNFTDLNLTTLQVSDTGIPTEWNSVTLHQGNFTMLNPRSHMQNFFTSPTMTRSNMFSRLLLPADINKTSANTLKITYDFVYS